MRSCPFDRGACQTPPFLFDSRSFSCIRHWRWSSVGSAGNGFLSLEMDALVSMSMATWLGRSHTVLEKLEMTGTLRCRDWLF